MKTEEFDDAIKRKLESINPAIDEKEIERVHSYTVSNRSSFSMLKTNRAFWALMAAGMLTTGLLTWKLTSMNSYIQKTASMSPPQVAPTQSEANKSPRIITKTDTVYVTKYIDKFSGLSMKPKGFISTAAKKKSNKFALADISEAGLTNNQSGANEVADKTNMNSGLVADATRLSSPVPQVSGNQVSNEGSGKSQSGDATKIAITSKSADAATEKKEPAKNISKKLPAHNYGDEHKNPSAKNALNLGFMAGIGGELANTQTGGGVYARLLLKRFSLNAGVKWMSVNYQHYGSDVAFNQAHPGDNFKWYYCPNLPHSYTVSNIRLAYSLWQIPLAVEYDLPVIKTLLFSVSAGTDLDVSCINTVKYTTSEGGENSNQANQVNNYPSVVFNNIVVSMGLTKQWNHLNLQISPFVSQQVEKAWYKGTDKTFYGGDVKLFYRF